MKRELDVTAYRMLTEYDKKGTLTSTIELRVPADELEYLGEVLAAQEDAEDVRCALVIRSKQDGAPRRLSLTLKNSKMKDFVPVAIFTKYGVASDNLTQLFDTGRYGQHELLLIVEVVEDRQDAEPLDFEGEPQTPTWVLEELLCDDLARERMLDEGCPNCPDVHLPGDEAFERIAALVASADHEEAWALLLDIQIDPTDWDDENTTPEQDLISMRGTLLLHWRALAAEMKPVPVLDMAAH